VNFVLTICYIRIKLKSPPDWGGRLGEGQTIAHHKKKACYEMLQGASELSGLL
jgi:hypothetical protein